MKSEVLSSVNGLEELWPCPPGLEGQGPGEERQGLKARCFSVGSEAGASAGLRAPTSRGERQMRMTMM